MCPDKKFTLATVHKSTLQQELQSRYGTNSNPDDMAEGTFKHNLEKEYLRLRKAGKPTEEVMGMLVAQNESFGEKKEKRIHLWGKPKDKPKRDRIEEVAAVGEKFIGAEPHWKNVKFERSTTAKVLGPNQELAGEISYQYDARVRRPPEKGKKRGSIIHYDFKFSEIPEAKVIEDETIVMDLTNGGTVNKKNLGKKLKSRLVYPDGVRGGEVDLTGREMEAKMGVVKTLWRLLTAAFESDDNKLNTVRHRVTKENWKKKKAKREPDENCGVQRQLL